MRIRVSTVAAVLVLLSACGGDDAPGDDATPVATPLPSPEAAPDPSPAETGSLDSAAALIDTREGSVLVRVEVASTDEERQRGLMGRRSLPEDHGMVFIWFEEHSGGFWMKDTLIPLSIAFFDEEGSIVSILDMDPCEADPCRVYDPGVPYHGALEVNQGMFDEWGVRSGDRVTLSF